ncbi:MAG: tRNA lysidine(34) synthetase TilS [Pyrinomonadaceae bacterium]|nr:tRNA lysidine(34) synthetase TilS [Pyrinomonadaceae bacterium]
MEDFTRKLITEWRLLDLPFEAKNIIIAVSGGADSCALALGLARLRDRNKLRNRFFVAHFNHRLRERESDIDAAFAEKFAREHDFEFILGKSEETVPAKGNLEQNARGARYQFLIETAIRKNCMAILTAHTKNDQAETILLNLIRGSGIEGLAGMKPVRKLEEQEFGVIQAVDHKVFLVRPMLSWALREDTVEFAEQNGVVFQEDAMNHDLSFNRVRVRKELIPILKGYNPKIIETLSSTARLLSQDAESLRRLTEKTDLSVKELRLCDLKLQKEADLQRLLRAWLGEMRGDLKGIDHKHIDAIVSLINSRKSGSLCELPGGDKVEKTNGKLIFVGLEVEKRF